MSQNPLVVPDGSGAQVRANFNLALDTLNTLNSGPGAPSNPEAFMLWADTGTGYLKQRNAANNAWVVLQPLDPSVPLSTNTGNAYSITLSPAITAYVGGCVYKFIPNASSTGAPTLSINGLAAVSISGATLQANQPVILIYDATDAIFIMAGASGGGSPPGLISAFGGGTAPLGWLLCQGQAVSRTTYASLFAIIGTNYGSGDGSTTFNLPNLQQRFPLGKAASGTGSTLGAAGGVIDHTHSIPALLLANSASNPDGSGILRIQFDGSSPGWELTPVPANITGADTSGSANPPFQVVNYIIKY